MEYRLIIVLVFLALSLHAAAKPITIYTSEPIKVEEMPKKKEPEKTKTENTPIHAIIQAYISPKPEEKKKPEEHSVQTLQPVYSLYSPYYSLYAVRPVNVVQNNFPFLYRLKLFYQMLG